MRIGEFDIAEPVPELRDPHMLVVLRPWIDVGNVGSLSLGRIERHLRSQELGRLHRPGRFYDFTRYRPRSYLVSGKREVTIPNTIVRYANPEEGQHLITAHLLEPHLYGEDYSEALLEIVRYFGVKQYALVGGDVRYGAAHPPAGGVGHRFRGECGAGLQHRRGPPQQTTRGRPPLLTPSPKRLPGWGWKRELSWCICRSI